MTGAFKAHSLGCTASTGVGCGPAPRGGRLSSDHSQRCSLQCNARARSGRARTSLGVVQAEEVMLPLSHDCADEESQAGAPAATADHAWLPSPQARPRCVTAPHAVSRQVPTAVWQPPECDAWVAQAWARAGGDLRAAPASRRRARSALREPPGATPAVPGGCGCAAEGSGRTHLETGWGGERLGEGGRRDSTGCQNLQYAARLAEHPVWVS